MAKIILNEQEFDFDGYGRNTYFNEGGMSSNGYINNLRHSNLANILTDLSETTITSIVITVENEPIYNLSNINAHITSIEEAFNGTDRITTNLNLQFNQNSVNEA
jgi:hypothetical protein